MHVLFEDAVVSINVGDVFSGAAPTFGSLASCMGTVKRLEVTDEIEKTDVHGAGSLKKLNRYHSESSTLTMDHFTPATGYLFATLGTLNQYGNSSSFIGKNIKVTVLPKSTLSTPDTYIGVITKWNGKFEQGQGTMENIEVDLNPDYTASE